MYVVTFLSVVIHSDRFVCFDLYSPLSLSSCSFFDILHCRVTLPIHLCDMPHDMTHFIYVTCLMHTCDTTQSYVQHDAFIHVAWLIHTCDMTHSYVWHDSFICVTWLIHTCDMTHSGVTGGFGQTVPFKVCHVWVMSHTWMSHDPYMNLSPTTPAVLRHVDESHMRHVESMRESCPTYEWLAYKPYLVKYLDEWCVIRATHIDESYVTCEMA